jgi:hypothetical protein
MEEPHGTITTALRSFAVPEVLRSSGIESQFASTAALQQIN